VSSGAAGNRPRGHSDSPWVGVCLQGLSVRA